MPADPVPPGARAALIRLCAAGFAAYCSHAICRTPLLPLFARELGAGPALGPIVAGILVAAVGYTRRFHVMAAVALTMADACAVASRIGVTDGLPRRT